MEGQRKLKFAVIKGGSLVLETYTNQPYCTGVLVIQEGHRRGPVVFQGRERFAPGTGKVLRPDCCMMEMLAEQQLGVASKRGLPARKVSIMEWERLPTKAQAKFMHTRLYGVV